MKHSPVFAAFVFAGLLALVGIVAVGPSLRDASAQDLSTEDHPLAGTWIADTDPEDPSNPLETFIFNADGSFINVDAEGTNLGAWEATGERTANLTVVSFDTDDDGGTAFMVTIRASFEVNEDGDTFTAQYTFDVSSADGFASGEAGPGTATGTRLVVEGPGTPVMSFDELFGQFESTPEATPVS